MKRGHGSTGRFYWWMGVVEDRQDPLRLGRCRVRIFGVNHPKRKDGQQKTEDLPWAIPMHSITSAAADGVGTAPLGPKEGTWVVGFFQDGANSQVPIMMGTFSGMPQKPEDPDEYGFRDFLPIEEDDVLYDGQSYRKEQPRLLSTRTLADDGSGSTFVEENGEDESGEPQADGYRDSYPREEFYTLRGKKGGDVSPLATVTSGRVSGAGALLEVEDIPDDVLHGSEKIVKHKIVTRQLGVSTGCVFQGLDEQLLFETPQLLECVFEGGNTGYYNGVDADISFDSGIAIITIPTCALNQKKTSYISEDTFELNEEGKWDEVHTQFYSQYPYNKVSETESGHIIEWDDTPGVERIHILHRTGSFIEWHPDGAKVEKVVNDNYTLYLKDDYIHIEGNAYFTVDKGAKLYINKDGDELNLNEQNHFDIKVGAGGHFNIEMVSGDIVAHLIQGDMISILDSGDVITHIAAGDMHISIADPDSYLNLVVGGGIRLESGKEFTIYAGGDLRVKVEGNLCADVAGQAGIKVGADAIVDVGGNLIGFANLQAHLHSNDQFTVTSNTRILMQAPVIDLNP